MNSDSEYKALAINILGEAEFTFEASYDGEAINIACVAKGVVWIDVEIKNSSGKTLISFPIPAFMIKDDFTYSHNVDLPIGKGYSVTATATVDLLYDGDKIVRNSVFDVEAKIHNISIVGGTASLTSGKEGTRITLTPGTAPEGKQFGGWKVISGGVNVSGNTFAIGSLDVVIHAVWEDIIDVTVEFGEGSTMTPTGPSSEVETGKPYSFTVSLEVGYDPSTLTVYVDGKILRPNINGVYVIAEVTKDTKITTEVEKRTYEVSLQPGDGFEIKPVSGQSLNVEHGDSFSFTVAFDLGEEYEVKANGVPLKGTNGTYAVDGVTGPLDITLGAPAEGGEETPGGEIPDGEGTSGSGTSVITIGAIAAVCVLVLGIAYLMHSPRNGQP